MGKYTLGQVIDLLELDEVAIKVDGMFNEECHIKGSDYVKTGVYYDKYDNNIFKALDGREIYIGKEMEGMPVDQYVIMPREAYDRVINDVNAK